MLNRVVPISSEDRLLCLVVLIDRGQQPAKLQIRNVHLLTIDSFTDVVHLLSKVNCRLILLFDIETVGVVVSLILDLDMVDIGQRVVFEFDHRLVYLNSLSIFYLVLSVVVLDIDLLALYPTLSVPHLLCEIQASGQSTL